MVSYRLIGTGTTNAQGIARCSNNYVGTGKGEVDIVASTDNPITEGSLQSETFAIIDATFYDDGVSGTASWDTAQATMDRTSGEYTELSTSETSAKFQLEAITDGIAIEFDYYCTNASEKGFSIRQSSTEVWARTLTQLGVNVNTWCNIKIELFDGEYQLYVDGIDKTPSTHSIQSFNRFFFRVTSDYRIRYKNFVIYPI